MTYDEFWLRYLRAHRRPRTRLLHYAGSLLALASVAAGAARRERRCLLVAPVLGYGFAWGAHVFVERNRPETFGHPFWSLLSDFRMLGLWLAGRLAPHLSRSAEAP